MHEQQQKQEVASRLYSEKQTSMANSQMNRQIDYHQTAQFHKSLAAENAKLTQERDANIRKLEEIEQQMVGNLQNTLARKNDAFKSLAGKSRSLKKAVEPRKAYKYAAKDYQESPSDAAMRTMQNFNSPQKFQD